MTLVSGATSRRATFVFLPRMIDKKMGGQRKGPRDLTRGSDWKLERDCGHQIHFRLRETNGWDRMAEPVGEEILCWQQPAESCDDHSDHHNHHHWRGIINKSRVQDTTSSVMKNNKRWQLSEKSGESDGVEGRMSQGMNGKRANWNP